MPLPAPLVRSVDSLCHSPKDSGDPILEGICICTGTLGAHKVQTPQRNRSPGDIYRGNQVEGKTLGRGFSSAGLGAWEIPE